MAPSLLFGHDPLERIVGLHPSLPGTMRVYRREGNRVTHADEPWFPFFFLTDPLLLTGFPKKHWVKELDGNLQFKLLCAFERWDDLWEAVRMLLQRQGIVASSPEERFVDLDLLFLIPDPHTQYFLQTGRTLYKGISFSDLRRLHVEPRFQREPGSSKSPRLTSIFLSDCREWEATLERSSEREILKRLVDIVHKQDPDLLQGPSMYRGTIPRLVEISGGMDPGLVLGRDGTPPSQPVARFLDPSAPRDAPLWEVAGRLILDLSAADPAPGGSAQRVQASRRLAERFFELAQMAPPAHGNARFPGIAKRFEHLLLREYIRARHSLPPLTPRGAVQKSSRETFYTGLLGPVVEAGFVGLQASEMLSHHIVSRNDPLGAIPAVLNALLEFVGKPHAQSSAGNTRTESVCETLIGAVIPYLHTGRTVFGDSESGTELEEAVRGSISSLEALVESKGAKLVSIEGEKLLVVPPPGATTAVQEFAFLNEIAQEALSGVRPIPYGRFRRVLCFRRNDIVYLEYDGTSVIRGPDLLSADLERFGRTFLEKCTTALLMGDYSAMHKIYVEQYGSIVRRSWDIRDFARTETIATSLQKYVQDVEEGKREKSAPYEVLLRTGRWLPPGSRVAYYVTQPGAGGVEPAESAAVGAELPPAANATYAFSRRWRAAEEWDRNFPDEDTAHYLERLEGLARRFAPFFEAEEFHAIFSSEELFPFDPARIVPITVRVREDRGEQPPPIHLGIWLDQ